MAGLAELANQRIADEGLKQSSDVSHMGLSPLPAHAYSSTLELRRPLPALEDVPEPLSGVLRDFLENLKEMSPVEKLQSIHDFVTNNMSYDETEARKETGMNTNYAEVLSGPLEGDCDNYATLETALLRYAGVDDSKISWVGSYTVYENSEGKEENSEAGYGGGHAVVVVEQDGENYLLDMNMVGPVKLNEQLQGTGISFHTGAPVELDMIPQYIVPIGADAPAMGSPHFIKDMQPESAPTPAQPSLENQPATAAPGMNSTM